MTPTEAIQSKYTQLLDKLLETKVWKLTNISNKFDFSEKLDTGAYELMIDKGLVAKFQLVPMINCCGICVSTQAYVTPAYQHKGIGTLLNSFRIDLARALGYGVLLCTDVVSNDYQRKVLAKNGWRDIYAFLNPRTNRKVAISIIGL